MNISALFIRRPVMTILISAAVFAFGIIAFKLLPVSELPNVDFPTIQVSASLPGASPETMASAVAAPLEGQFSTISGLSSMSSINTLGSTRITLQFDLNRNIDAAAQDVQEAIAEAQRLLPPNMPSPPRYRKVNPAEQPILFMAMSSSVLPLSKVQDYADTVISPTISMLSGVAQVEVFGAQKYAVRVLLDPQSLAKRGLGIDEISSAIQNANVTLPTGSLSGEFRTFTLQAEGELEDAAAFRPLIVAYRNGSPIRLEELGSVIDSVENDQIASWYVDTRAIVLAVQRQPGTNTVQVVDRIRKVLPSIRGKMPASINLSILYDRSQSIRSSINDVELTLLIAVVLVVLVIFFFLRNVSATLIPSFALPLSILGTFAAMYVLGYSINNLSMLALILSVGFVVDDAIVMLENNFRHMENGEAPYQAALNGSREISFTILSMTISLVAVFIPVIFLGGILGRILHQFAVTIGVAILISGAVSLSLTPMLCSRFLRLTSKKKQGALYRFSEAFVSGLRKWYELSLKFVLAHRPLTMLFTALMFLATFYLYYKIPKGFIPTEDTGRLFGYTEAEQGISFDSMVKHQLEVNAVLEKDPNIESFMASVGAGGPIAGGNAGFMFIALKPRPPRQLSPDGVIMELRRKISQIPGIRIFLQNPPALPIGGFLSKSQYQLSLQGLDTAQLYHYSEILESKLKQLPQLQDVTSDLLLKNPQVNITIDRNKASQLGVSAKDIESELYAAYGSSQVSTIYTSNNQYSVIMEVEPRFKTDPSLMSMLYVQSSSGTLVPLDAVTTVHQTTGPVSVNHIGQFPAVTLSFNLAPGVALGEAVVLVDKTAGAVLPASITASFQGTAQTFRSTFIDVIILLGVAVLAIYLVLGILYESFIHPITILSGLPAAGFGALLTLLVFGQQLDLYAFVGIFMLIGIVKKNAIMMIDFALNAERNRRLSATDAIYEGALIRFRPIMMTTMSAIMGTLPIAIGFGIGAASRRPIGLAVVGGLVFSQMLTLYITPVIYTYLDSFQKRIGRFRVFQLRGDSR